MERKIAVIGGDMRCFYITENLIREGFKALWYACEGCPAENRSFIADKDFYRDAELFDTVILPLPLTKDLRYLNTPFSEKKLEMGEIREIIRDKLIFSPEDMAGRAINYFRADEVVIANARLTAVGLLTELLKATDYDIMGKTALITGFGNVGKATAKILKDNGLSVMVCARSRDQRALAEAMGLYSMGITDGAEKISEFNFIVNTVPSAVFSRETLLKSDKEAVFLELAQGLDKETCSSRATYISCKGMPGKHTPKSAGKVISDYITARLKA